MASFADDKSPETDADGDLERRFMQRRIRVMKVENCPLIYYTQTDESIIYKPRENSYRAQEPSSQRKKQRIYPGGMNRGGIRK